ncbi:MAG: ATPase [Candidatus Moraniibacteriota bacterium]|nr:MAG: ATPase [Candidatus Moranbacteria bacterium]
MNKQITKTSGDIEVFSLEKLKKSLERAGVDNITAENIAKDVADETDVATTVDVHEKTYKKLKEKYRPVAARYNLKRALKALGPSGYPFEQFFARLLNARGYKTSTNRTIRGRCVSHEIDVMAYKDNRHFIFECKFHNNLGYKSDVQTVLYMKARFDDIKERWAEVHEGKGHHLHKLWIITNTQFTKQARTYAKCNDIELMSWRYPKGRSLAELIDQTGLHPITAITRLNRRQKDYLINQGVVLCQEALQKPEALKKAGVHGHKLKQVLSEADAIVHLKNT